VTRTVDELRIFWHGEERPGILAYGLWSPPQDAGPQFPRDAWPRGTDVDESRLFGPWAGEPWEAGEPWAVFEWRVLVRAWPEPQRWRATLEATLGTLMRAGARVAWCALEGVFVEPPALFEPERTPPGVWAALLPGGELLCHAELDGPFASLSADELRRLHGVVPR
jgi:hypothetical protein